MRAEAIAAALDGLRAERPATYELACVLSLASRVERSLLRRARLMLANADASAEADLWASRLAVSRTPQGFLFEPRAAEALRARLAENPPLLDKAWALISWAHRDAAWPLRAEELMNRLSVSQAPEEIDRAEQVLLATAHRMVESKEPRSVAQWVMRTLTRLPAPIGNTPTAHAIQAGVGAHLDGAVDVSEQRLPNDVVENWLPWLLSNFGKRVQVGIVFGDGFVEIDPESPESDAAVSLPDTTPLVLDLRWHDGLTPHSARVTCERGTSTRPRVAVNATEIEVRTLDGARYRARRPGAANRRGVFDYSAVRARHRPFLGRNEELNDLRKMLETSNVAITGPTGVGNKVCS